MFSFHNFVCKGGKIILSFTCVIMIKVFIVLYFFTYEKLYFGRLYYTFLLYYEDSGTQSFMRPH